MTRSEMLKFIGDPKKVGKELEEFRGSAKVFSTTGKVQLIKEYPKQWVAATSKGVVAHAASLPALKKKLAELDLPPGRVMVRFIEKKKRHCIL